MFNTLVAWLDKKLVASYQAMSLMPWADQLETGNPPNGVEDGGVWLGDAWLCIKESIRCGPRRAMRRFLELRTLRRAPFNSSYYSAQLEMGISVEPVRHYAMFSRNTKLDPNPYFNTAFYLRTHRDVAAAGVNPYVHFLTRGHIEGRRFEPSHFGTGRPANYLHIEDWQVVPWPAKQAGVTPSVGLYDQRPDDAVVQESKAGEAFLHKYRLLSSGPDFAGAVESLLELEKSLEAQDKPDVSIIIPVYGQLSYTLNCLDALYRHSSRYSKEILIGDDASPDQTSQWLSHLHHIQYVRHAQNGGFIQNCNTMAALARGRFIVFLNNDTRVVDGWLDGLIDSFSIFPDAGLVGSKLFYPDASLQEAGGIVWRDGSAWNYGRNDDPNRSRYSHARKVDYVSGCSISLRRETWQTLGGFDTYYAPAYYEDTDLAFRIRENGMAVYMQPLSKVIHYEGKTSGTDLSQGAKAYQIENQRKFFERWKDVLVRYRENGAEPWLERQRDVNKRVLIIDTVMPTPDRDAGSVVTVALMRAYQQLGYQVLFLAEDNFLYDPVATPPLQAMGVECLYAPYETSLSEVLRRYAPYLDLLQLIRPEPAARALEAMERENIQLPTLYLNADLHFLRMQRQAELEGDAEMMAAAETMKGKELSIVRKVGGTFVHSSFEAELLAQEVAEARVGVLPLVYETVDVTANLEMRKDIMFLGGFNHPPNLDAALWLIDDIWPRISGSCPEAKLLIVGANPPPELKKRASGRIVIAGHVPNLAPWFARTRVFVAPLRFGAGAKGKIVSALAHGVPIVATPLAVEGMGFDVESVGLKGGTSDDLAYKVTTLYNSQDDIRFCFSAAAFETVKKYFSHKAMIESLATILKEVEINTCID